VLLETCIYIYPMRRPLRTDNEYTEYVKDFYRKIEDYDWVDVTDHFRGLESFLHKSREKQIRKLIKQYSTNGHYLDVGCGTGLLLRHLPKGSIGIDINPRHVERAKKYAADAEVFLGDVESMEFPEQNFSNVIFTEVLEHLVHPEKTLDEIKRVLKPGGILIGSTPGLSVIWKFRFLSSTHYHNEPFHNEFTKKELLNYFKGWNILFLKSAFFNSSYYFVLQKHDS